MVIISFINSYFMLKFDSAVDINGTHMLGYLYVCEDELPNAKQFQKLYKYKYDARVYNNSNIFWFEDVVARLYNISNQNIFEQGDEYKLSFEIIGSYDNKPFTLYDYKGDNCVHIGGNDDLDFVGLKKDLVKELKTTNPKHFTANLNYDHCKGCTYSYPRKLSDNNSDHEANE